MDMDFGVMVHSRDFEKGVIRLAPYRMHQGVICFPDQEECITRTCRAGGLADEFIAEPGRGI
ncbi:MAG: hypothetical protein ACLTBV_31550 [Enterocloster bolteae]